jgi:hypothetical protein
VLVFNCPERRTTPPNWHEKGRCIAALRCIDVLTLGVRTDDQHTFNPSQYVGRRELVINPG